MMKWAATTNSGLVHIRAELNGVGGLFVCPPDDVPETIGKIQMAFAREYGDDFPLPPAGAMPAPPGEACEACE